MRMHHLFDFSSRHLIAVVHVSLVRTHNDGGLWVGYLTFGSKLAVEYQLRQTNLYDHF
jgi:hypothetical protein